MNFTAQWWKRGYEGEIFNETMNGPAKPAAETAPSAGKWERFPPQIKLSFWLMTIAGGHFLIAVITGLNARFVNACGASEFYFFAALMLVVAGVFVVCASRLPWTKTECTGKCPASMTAGRHECCP